MVDYIVLTPIIKSNNLNVSLIERKTKLSIDEENNVFHKGGGPYTGFVVNGYKNGAAANNVDVESCHLSFKLNVYMKHTTHAEIQQEIRTLKFWFFDSSEEERVGYSHDFFRILFRDDGFPKDYFKFLLRLMQLLKAFTPIRQIKVEIEKIGSPLPLGSPMKQKDPKEYATLISEKILEFLERAFPNTISVEELARLTEADVQFVYDLLRDLLQRNLVKYYDNGTNWMRNIISSQDHHEVINIQQNPTIVNDDQPNVAIITVNYYEKLAVDAMMVNKVTFVRHKPEGLGESNVYTIGNIGPHRVISTKLPSLSRDMRSSKISSGSTTTRLLGIFQRIEHVLLVGCGGGIPHYSDCTKHPRRGDIVVSYPQSDENDFVYAHFEIAKQQQNNEVIWKTWKPGSYELYRIVNEIRKNYNPAAKTFYPWEQYLSEGVNALYNEELDYRRPKDDKLFFTVGDKNVIEVNHPEDPYRRRGQPMLKFGVVGGGEKLLKDENLKQSLSNKFAIACFDSDLDQVMESIDGNRKDSFIIIRAITDYYDGTTCKEWQPYAALCAAAFMKTILCALPETPKSPTY